MVDCATGRDSENPADTMVEFDGKEGIIARVETSWGFYVTAQSAHGLNCNIMRSDQTA
jgi:hypothetical protein